MTIDYAITIGGALNARSIARAQNIVNASFDEVNAIYNQWNASSEISALNRLPANTRVRPSDQLYHLLRLVDEIVRLSNGRYDPTIEPLTHLWQSELKQGRVPSPETVHQVAPAIGWGKIHLDNGDFWKSEGGVQINLDSISKGLCVDILTERLVAAGFADVLVEWGGEIRAAGHHPLGRPWHVYIRRLHSIDPEHALAAMDLVNSAVATSGDYLQQWTVTQEGKATTYFHIIDPHALRPLTMHPGSVASATVEAPTCALADALATAAICFDDIQSAKAWAERVHERFPHTTFWLAGRI